MPATVTDAYATAATYRDIFDKSVNAEDPEILTDLTALSRYLDREMGRFFTKDAAPVARTFMPEGNWRTLWVDDLVSVTTIKLDDNADGTAETALAAGDYVLTPRNAALGSEARPYTAVEMTNTGTRLYFPGHRVVEITGVWGWPAVPDAIARATCHLTAILRLETARAQAMVSEIGQLMQMSPKAMGIVDRLAEVYRRRSP